MNFNYVFMPIIIFVAGVFIIWLSSRRILALSKKTYQAWRKIVEQVSAPTWSYVADDHHFLIVQ
jgi:hypothetical protein